MASPGIWHWLIVLGVIMLTFSAKKKLDSVGGAVGAGTRNLKKALNLPIWLHIMVASMLLLCLLVIVGRLTAQ